jgi:DUF4097 and DUF4098 domain-containing protein YvlB
MASWEYPRTEPIELRVQIAAGSVTINAEPTDAVRLSIDAGSRDGNVDDVRVHYTEGRLQVTEPKPVGLFRHRRALDVQVTVPVGSDCAVNTASAEVRCDGEPGRVDIHTASGDVSVPTVRMPSGIHTASGDVSIGDADAVVTAYTASGQIHVAKATADVTATSASGDISIDGAGASVAARTASGEITVTGAARGQVQANSVSGDITIKVAPGTGVYLELSSLSGEVTSDLEPLPEPPGHADLRVTGHSLSGDIRVARSARDQMTAR